jgi:DNA-binding transcriptional MerR regulator
MRGCLSHVRILSTGAKMSKTYSVSAVFGMTGIPVRTIHNYVRDLRECFSDEANKPVKGRQFSDLDIKRLRVIKQARAQKMSDEDIKKIFTGEIFWPLMNEYDDQAAKQMILNAQETYERAGKLVDKVEGWIIAVNTKTEKVIKDMEVLRQENESLKINIQKLLEWRMYMFQLEGGYYNPYAEERQASEQNAPKKKGLFSRGD